MKVNIIHPEQQSLTVIEKIIEQQEVIYRSPHVGNVNNQELQLMHGLSAIGATVQLEMVDTIRGDDNYSNPRVAVVGGNVITLASRNYAKSRIVGSCEVSADGVNSMVAAGLEIPSQNIKELHLAALQSAAPEGVQINASSEIFAEIGQLAYQSVLQESASVVQRPVRVVDVAGKIKNSDTPDFTNIYGLGDEPEQGLLPPLEGMMAIELVAKALDSNGNDGRIVHVAGPDMIKYTKLSEVMGPVQAIASRVLSDLGMAPDIEIDYVVPCMKTIINDANFDSVIGQSIQSQYDILATSQLHKG